MHFGYIRQVKIIMILINNQWEQIDNLFDIVRIVKENIGDEFAREIEKVCGKASKGLEERIYELESELDDMEIQTNDYDDILQSLNYLNEQLDKLQEYIDENEDGSDFMKGMIKANEMIER